MGGPRAYQLVRVEFNHVCAFKPECMPWSRSKESLGVQASLRQSVLRVLCASIPQACVCVCVCLQVPFAGLLGELNSLGKLVCTCFSAEVYLLKFVRQVRDASLFAQAVYATCSLQVCFRKFSTQVYLGEVLRMFLSARSFCMVLRSSYLPASCSVQVWCIVGNQADPHRGSCGQREK